MCPTLRLRLFIRRIYCLKCPIIDHRYINSTKRLTDPALFKWLQGGLKLGQGSELITRNVCVLLFVDRSSIYSFMPCLIYIRITREINSTSVHTTQHQKLCVSCNMSCGQKLCRKAIRQTTPNSCGTSYNTVFHYITFHPYNS